MKRAGASCVAWMVCASALSLAPMKAAPPVEMPDVQGPATLVPIPPPQPVGHVLHDSLGMVPTCTYNTKDGNTCGGGACSQGWCMGAQLCDDFVVPAGGAWISEVTGAFLASGCNNEPLYFANVSIYAETSPGSCTPANTATCSYCSISNVTLDPFVDCHFGLQGYYITVRLPCDCFLPQGRWFVSIQPYNCYQIPYGDWYSQVRSVGILTPCDSHLRDSQPLDPCCSDGLPWYGFSNWTAAGNAGYGEGDAAFRVVACQQGTCRYMVTKVQPLVGDLPCGKRCTRCRHQIGDIVCCGPCFDKEDCPGHDHRLVAYCDCEGGGTCKYVLKYLDCAEIDCVDFCP